MFVEDGKNMLLNYKNIIRESIYYEVNIEGITKSTTYEFKRKQQDNDKNNQYAQQAAGQRCRWSQDQALSE